MQHEPRVSSDLGLYVHLHALFTERLPDGHVRLDLPRKGRFFDMTPEQFLAKLAALSPSSAPALWHVDADGVEGPRRAIVEELAGLRYDSVDLLGVSALDEVIAAGSFRSTSEEYPQQWMRGY